MYRTAKLDRRATAPIAQELLERRILLLISTCVLASAQDCGPPDPSCSPFYNSPVAGNPCWLVSLNQDEKVYCHKGKNLRIIASDKDKVANINCDSETLDCSSLPAINFARGGQVNRLEFRNCGLNESISCALRALNATGLNGLSLFFWTTNITTETLSGLDGLKRFVVYDSDVFTRIPTEALKQHATLQKICMSGTNISSIPARAFAEFAGLNITHLELSRNKVTELNSDAFEGLHGLIDLSLNKNEIRAVDKDAFKGLPLLETLVLEDNPLEELPAGVFADNPNLKILDILRNRAGMRLRNGSLTGLKKLELLEISMYNEPEDRLLLEERSLSGLQSLKRCVLSAAGIQELPTDLFKGTKALEELNLDHNELRLLPEHVFEDLENLKVLSLSNNKLQNPIGNYSSIYEGPFTTLGKLETLNLARNDLQDLPMQMLIGISSLKNLDLSYNQLNFKCRIRSTFVEGGTIQTNYNLNSSPLSALNNLVNLNLSHNNLTSVCDDFLNIMLLLQNLDLSYNNLPALTKYDVKFGNNGVVDFRYNNVTSIEPGDRQDEPKPTLLVGNNPYNCDCKLFTMLANLKNLKYDLSQATCSKPKALEEIPLVSIAEGINSTSLDNLTCVLPDSPNNCECLVRPSKHMTECVCNEIVTNLPDPNNTIRYSLTEDITNYSMLLKLKTIDKLETIPNFVTNLSLSNLGLETVPNIPKHISYVDLTYNKLEKIPAELLSRNLTFNLSHNIFKCTCLGQSDIKNLQKYKNKIYDYSSLVCHDGSRVDKIQVPHLCDEFRSYVIGFSIATIGLFIAIITILAYKYQLEIKIWLYNQGWTFGLFNYEKAIDASKKYDIFLSYCHEDEDYVVNELLPFMEAKYEVCIHTKHFIPGEDIMTQIYRAVADSRRTVIVASKAYFKSPWCLEEMRAAYKQTEIDQRIRAVVILRTDVDPKSKDISETVRSYLNLNTWIGEKDTRFWYRLCYFLPRDVTVEDLRLMKVTNEATKNLSGQLNKVFVIDGKLGIDNKACEVNGNLARNLCGVNKDDKKDLNDEVQLAIDNLRGLDAVCNNGELVKNLPDTLNVVRNEDGNLVNVAIVKNGKE